MINYTVQFTEAEIDAHIILENEKHRLLPEHHAAVEGKTAYPATLLSKLVDLSRTTLNWKIRDGFKTSSKKSICYLECATHYRPRQDKVNTVSFISQELLPGTALQMTFSVRCSLCEAVFEGFQEGQGIQENVEEIEGVNRQAREDAFNGWLAEMEHREQALQNRQEALREFEEEVSELEKAAKTRFAATEVLEEVTKRRRLTLVKEQRRLDKIEDILAAQEANQGKRQALLDQNAELSPRRSRSRSPLNEQHAATVFVERRLTRKAQAALDAATSANAAK